MPKTYKTQLGDTWDYIAYKIYGTELAMNALLEANPEHREEVVFDSNIELTLPLYQAPSTSTLPPWRR